MAGEDIRTARGMREGHGMTESQSPKERNGHERVRTGNWIEELRTKNIRAASLSVLLVVTAMGVGSFVPGQLL